MKHFEKLFEPRSIAVVGVSEDPARPGSQAVHALLTHGYSGAIYPVNPKYPMYEGMRCYPAVSAIGREVDLAVIGVPARGVIGVMEDCARARVPFVVVPSGGFRESGAEGAALQDRMIALARASGMRIVGPNCLGLVNVHEGVYAGFGSITRPPALAKGSVSLVTQSGGFGYSIALACAQAGIGFRNIVATGNEADIGMVEFLDALLDDPGTSTILAYIEGLANGRALLDVGRRALALGKPLLVWKGGVTEEGAKAAATHTANLTGSYDFYQALFGQAGIVEIRELHEAADYVKAFAAKKLPSGRRVAVMGGSGGSAIVFADAAEQSGLSFATFSEETKRRLSQVVLDIGTVHNPVDFTAGYISAANADKFSAAVEAVLEDPGVDAVCINLATTSAAACAIAARVLGALVKRTSKPLAVFLATSAAEATAILEEAGIAVVPSPVRAARLLAMLARYREARDRCADLRPAHLAAAVYDRIPLTAFGRSLPELQAKAALECAGIAVSRDVLVRSAGDADITQLSPPLAVKIASADIPHKTEVGGVKLDIRTPGELAAAIDEVLLNARTLAPNARIDGVLVSEMLTGGFELIAGAVNDAVFGPVVIVGAGGVYAEAFDDTACRLAPFESATALEMIAELRCRSVLAGARGKPALDVNAVARALCALSHFAWENRATIAEIDINPLIALPAGAVAADALIIGIEGEKEGS
ncbi:MAG TPA: acetate--CoA ligase family protein [Burkholderiales bacterium]|nr:acetate--CoA ligase family protein [Burkholderiales bacterium]